MDAIFPQLKIAVVDDHDLIREGLKAILEGHGVGSVEKFGSAFALLSRLGEGVDFDFYVIDIELPDVDGLTLTGKIRAINPDARIIVSTIHDEIWTLRKLIAYNVDGIIYKSGDSEEVVTAIHEIQDGRKYYCEQVTNTLDLATKDANHPTARELEVLNEIALGKTSREIAEDLFVSDNTIEAHRKALLTKLGAINVADMIVKAMEKGYISKRGRRF